YSGAAIFSRIPAAIDGKAKSATPNHYREWLTSLAPQYRDIFKSLLKGKGAVSFHCSAGQDRSGVAAALILSALGVPRDVIFADHPLPTAHRPPESEMPPIDPSKSPGNVVATGYAHMQATGVPKPKPLYDASGVAYLQQTFDEIDAHWGSVDNYLDKQLGVS